MVNRREDVSLRRARFGRARQLRNPWGASVAQLPKATTPPPLRCCVRANNAALGSNGGHLYAAAHWSSSRGGLPCGLLARNARLAKKARSAHPGERRPREALLRRRRRRRGAPAARAGLSEGGGPRRRHRRGRPGRRPATERRGRGDRRGLICRADAASYYTPLHQTRIPRRRSSGGDHLRFWRASASKISIRCSPRPGRRCGRTSRSTSCP